MSSPLCHIPIVAKPASLHLSEVWKSKAEIYNHLGDVVFLVIVADSSRKKVDSNLIFCIILLFMRHSNSVDGGPFKRKCWNQY